MPFAATPLYVAKATLFRTLGHPARVRILELLRDGEHAVGALQEALDLDSGGTSQHLAALRRIGLVESRGKGRGVLPGCRLRRVRVARRRARAGRADASAAAGAARGARFGVTALVVAGLRLSWRVGCSAARGRGLAAGLRVQAVGALAFGVAGLWALDSGDSWGAAFTSELSPHAGIDGLTGVFLFALAIVACPALVCASSSTSATVAGRTTGVLGAVFVLALIGVVCARDALSFLFFWELMTLVPAVIILAVQAGDAARQTVFTYVSITHLGGAGTWIAVLLLAHEGALGDTNALHEGSAVQAVIAVAAIVGFGTKAGLMPMHAWLPRAHPIAPAHISALMSGVMVAVAAYGLVRVLVDLLGPVPSWIGVTVLALGGLSALGGITYALFQRDLKRLLAYSTVEHLGIVAWGSVRVSCSAATGPMSGRRSRSARPCCTPSTTQRSRRCSSLPPGFSSGRPGGWSSTGSVGSCGGCRGADGVPRRLTRDRGHPAPQRLRLGMVDAAGTPARTRVRGRLGRHARSRRSRGARGDDGPGGPVFRQGDRLVLLGPPRRKACAEASDPPPSMRWSLVALAGTVSRSALCRACCSRDWSRWRPGLTPEPFRRGPAWTCREQGISRRSASS